MRFQTSHFERTLAMLESAAKCAMGDDIAAARFAADFDGDMIDAGWENIHKAAHAHEKIPNPR